MAVEEDLVAPALNFGADPDPCLGDPDDLEGDAPDELNFAWDGPDDWLKEELSETEGEELVGAVITPSDEDNTSRVELYDSGATRHISPFKPDFTAYSLLSPPVFVFKHGKSAEVPCNWHRNSGHPSPKRTRGD